MPEDPLQSPLQRLSERLTLWVGSTASIVLHSLIFIGIFGLHLVGISFDHILLVLTTAVSLEAIYLAIFIQMTVNRNTQSLEGVEEDIEELGEEVEDIGEDIEELGEDIDRVGEKVEGLDEGLDELAEDVEEMQAEDAEEARHELGTRTAIDNIETSMRRLMEEIEALKQSVRK